MPDRTRRCFGIALFASASPSSPPWSPCGHPGRDQSVTVLCGTRSTPREVDLLVLVLLFALWAASCTWRNRSPLSPATARCGELVVVVPAATGGGDGAGAVVLHGDSRRPFRAGQLLRRRQPIRNHRRFRLVGMFPTGHRQARRTVRRHVPDRCRRQRNDKLSHPSLTFPRRPEPESVVWSPSCHRIPI